MANRWQRGLVAERRCSESVTITPSHYSVCYEKTQPLWAVFTELAEASCSVTHGHSFWFWSTKSYLSMWSGETSSGSASTHLELKKDHAEPITIRVSIKQGCPVSSNQSILQPRKRWLWIPPEQMPQCGKTRFTHCPLLMTWSCRLAHGRWCKTPFPL